MIREGGPDGDAVARMADARASRDARLASNARAAVRGAMAHIAGFEPVGVQSQPDRDIVTLRPLHPSIDQTLVRVTITATVER